MSKSKLWGVWSPLQTTEHYIDDFMLTEPDKQNIMTTLDILVK